MDNLWKYLTIMIVLILFAIAIVVYESITKGDEYIFKIIAFSLVAIFLVSVNIPNTVTEIDFSAFSNCISLKEILIPSSVEKIGLKLKK